MDIDPSTAAGTSEYKGQTYYFCSLGCKKSFDTNPEKYLGKTAEHPQHH
jgi:Cu+-exporting ATPase